MSNESQKDSKERSSIDMVAREESTTGILPPVVIKTSFGSSVAEKKQSEPDPTVSLHDQISDPSEELQKHVQDETPVEEVRPEKPSVPEKEESPIICPRATMELSHAHELLSSIRLEFKEEAKQIEQSLKQYAETKAQDVEKEESLGKKVGEEIGKEQSVVEEKTLAVEDSSETSERKGNPLAVSLNSHNPERLSQLMQLAHGQPILDEEEAPGTERALHIGKTDETENRLRSENTVELPTAENLEKRVSEAPLEPVQMLPAPNDSQQSIFQKQQEDQKGEADSNERALDSWSSQKSESGAFWSQCEEFALQGDWSALNALASQGSSECPQEKKYWWMRSAKELGSLSASLLTAPLQDLLRDIQEKSGLATSSFDEPSKRVALEQLGRRIVLDAVTEGQGAAQVYDLLNRLGGLTGESGIWDKEHAALRGRLESKAEFERSELEQSILTELKKLERTKKNSGEPTVASLERDPMEDPGGKPVATLPSSSSPETSRSFHWSAISSAARRLSLPVSVVALVLALAFGFKSMLGTSVAYDVQTALYTKLPLGEPALLPPTQTNLDTRLFKGMLLDAGGTRGIGKKRAVSSAQSAPEDKKLSPRAEEVFRKERLGAGNHGVVNTTGPIEPKGLFLDRDGSPSEERSVIGQDYVKGLGAAMIAKKPRKPLAEAPEAKLFTVSVDTNVLNAPSLDARVLERIQRGVKVRVLQQFGDWLLLTSHDGQPGYILKQDAIETGLSRS